MRPPPSWREKARPNEHGAARRNRLLACAPPEYFCFPLLSLIVDQVKKFDNRPIWKRIVLEKRTIAMDELAGIRMFVRVVEGGSFVAAARGLGLSKSVISKRVRELEDRLKAQLLVRSTRRLTLTDAGASYFERCVRIVAELDEAQSAVRSLTVGLTGTLRISCIASFLAHQLARDVCRFQ